MASHLGQFWKRKVLWFLSTNCFRSETIPFLVSSWQLLSAPLCHLFLQHWKFILSDLTWWKMTRRGLTDRTIAQMLEEVSATNIYLFKIKSWKLKLKVKKLFYCIQILCHPYFFWLVPRPALNFCRMRIRNNYSGSGKKIRVRPDPDHHPCSKLPMLLQIFCYSDKKGSDLELKHYFRTLEPECFSSGSSSLLIWIRMTGTGTLCAFSRNKIFIIVIL